MLVHYFINNVQKCLKAYRITDRCNNITFPQLLLRTVIMESVKLDGISAIVHDQASTQTLHGATTWLKLWGIMLTPKWTLFVQFDHWFYSENEVTCRYICQNNFYCRSKTCILHHSSFWIEHIITSLGPTPSGGDVITIEGN